MKHFYKNPRKISKKEFADLRDSLRKFGDLSGVVHNLLTDEIIGGNQRMDIFDIHNAKIEIVERLENPDEQGTVATGWVWWEGKRYAYRAVSWDEKQAEEANIRANKAGGNFDFDVLANQWEVGDLLEWGFKNFELGIDNPIDYADAMKGMPEFESDDLSAMKSVIVHFDSQEAINNFSDLVEQTITAKTKSIYYPKKERANLLGVVAHDES